MTILQIRYIAVLTALIFMVSGTVSAQTADGKRVEGKWNITVDAPGQPVDVLLELAEDGDKLAGVMSSAFIARTEISNGKVTEDGFSFDVAVEFGGESINITMTGKISGDKVTGTAATDLGDFSFTGARAKEEDGDGR